MTFACNFTVEIYVFACSTKQFNDRDTMVLFLVPSMLWENRALQRGNNIIEESWMILISKEKRIQRFCFVLFFYKPGTRYTSKCRLRGNNQYTDTVYIIRYNMHFQMIKLEDPEWDAVDLWGFFLCKIQKDHDENHRLKKKKNHPHQVSQFKYWVSCKHEPKKTKNKTPQKPKIGKEVRSSTKSRGVHCILT